ncbi:ferroxidase fet3 [Coemansia guatemalensis]|uniref:Ferroxidase fet3 n=1 Tax=Coemansia guatemalensis TaxID=2761395 RepID=A0A9W8LT63_9FUNG|nr:ferroxidase fet3 [Coemansia guatemalensis]
MRLSTGLLLLFPLVEAKRVVENWDITYVTTNRGLDQPPKRGIGVNGQLPLPVIEAEIGDTLVLNVHNSLDKPTSLHAHGILQYETNYYDGVAMVNSCPIAPGTNFTYEIPLKQSGTYWVHGHTSEENYEGLRAPLVVYDRNDPYPVSKSYLFAVEDWWPLNIGDTLKMMQTPGRRESPFSHPPQTLINGAFGKLTKPIYFEPDQTYRIRLLSMASLPLWEFTMDGHELYIIEVDGVLTKPKLVNVVRMAPAQRVSVLVKAKSSTRVNYQYHINVLKEGVPFISDVFPAQFDGSVIYDPNARISIANSIPSAPLDELSIESLEYEPPLIPDRALFLNLTYGYSEEKVHYQSINLITYQSSLVPSIFSALTTGDRAINPITYGPQTNTHVIKHDEVVELLLWSSTEQSHPIHLHGHVFQIIETGSTNDLTGESRRTVPQSYFSPLKRDTVHIYPGHYAVVRFRANNPGVWNLHCHFDWHMGMGFNKLFVVAPEEMQKNMVIPPSVVEQCHIQGIQTWGNAAGHNTYNYRGAPELPYLTAKNPNHSSLNQAVNASRFFFPY